VTAPISTAVEQPDLDAIVGTVSDDGEIEIKDFTLKTKRFGFKIDNDKFIAHAALGLPTMQELSKVTKNLGEAIRSGDYEPITDIFRELLEDKSAQRFAQRVVAKGEDAIDVKKQLMPILYWLLEKYGLRPTQLSSVSSTGSPSGTGGTTSTVGSSNTDIISGS
jgi:hypothetical protein